MDQTPATPSKPEEKTENSATVTVSTERPEMALLPGGLFVMAIPLNSRMVNRVIAYGFVATAMDKLREIYNDMERLKEKNKKPGLVIPSVANLAAAAGRIFTGNK